MATPSRMRIKFEVDETRIDFEVEKWPSGQLTLSHTCMSTTPRLVLPTSQTGGPPLKRRRTSTTHEDDAVEEEPVVPEEPSIDNVTNDNRNDDIASRGAEQRANREQSSDKGKNRTQEQGINGQSDLVQAPRIGESREPEEEKKALALYPLEVRESMETAHEVVWRARAERSSRAEISICSADSSSVRPEKIESRQTTPSEVFLLTHSQSSSLSYTVLGAFVRVEDANVALLRLLEQDHLAVLYRPSALWTKTECLTPPHGGVAWWIDDSGALAIATDDEPPDDHMFKVMWMSLH